MPWNDPFPESEFLGLPELGKLLSMGRTTLYEFLADPTTAFPLPADLGRTPDGHPRKRWRKLQVYAWMQARPDVQPSAPDAEDARPRRPRRDESG